MTTASARHCLPTALMAPKVNWDVLASLDPQDPLESQVHQDQEGHQETTQTLFGRGFSGQLARPPTTPPLGWHFTQDYETLKKVTTYCGLTTLWQTLVVTMKAHRASSLVKSQERTFSSTTCWWEEEMAPACGLTSSKMVWWVALLI